MTNSYFDALHSSLATHAAIAQEWMAGHVTTALMAEALQKLHPDLLLDTERRRSVPGLRVATLGMVLTVLRRGLYADESFVPAPVNQWAEADVVNSCSIPRIDRLPVAPGRMAAGHGIPIYGVSDVGRLFVAEAVERSSPNFNPDTFVRAYIPEGDLLSFRLFNIMPRG